MKKFANIDPPFERAAQPGEVFQEINVIQKRLAKSVAGLRVLLPRPEHDLREIG
jgi:hypothetical protein